jgi:hypothetical protein
MLTITVLQFLKSSFATAVAGILTAASHYLLQLPFMLLQLTLFGASGISVVVSEFLLASRLLLPSPSLVDDPLQ